MKIIIYSSSCQGLIVSVCVWINQQALMAISEYLMLWKIGDSFCMNQIEQIQAKLLVKKLFPYETVLKSVINWINWDY